jgi:hypothetical protein
MEAEEPELDISQMLPEATGFIPFAGSGNRRVQIIHLKEQHRENLYF